MIKGSWMLRRFETDKNPGHLTGEPSDGSGGNQGIFNEAKASVSNAMEDSHEFK
jgi:hypothetical protein